MASVCIKPYAVALATRVLNETGVFVGTTIGFPHGGHVTAGTDLNKDGNLNDRPLYTARNSVTGPSILEVDGRLQRAFVIRERYRLIGSFETENLLNSTNASCSTSGGCTGAVVSTAGAVGFGRITSAWTARNVQFGIKVTF